MTQQQLNRNTSNLDGGMMMTNEDNYLLITNLHSYAHYEEQNECPKTASNLRKAAVRLEALTAENAELKTECKEREDAGVQLAMMHGRLQAENEKLREQIAELEKPVVVIGEPYRQYCDRCDGVGWYEGGPTLQTMCDRCGGTGHIYVAREALKGEQ